MFNRFRRTSRSRARYLAILSRASCASASRLAAASAAAGAMTVCTRSGRCAAYAVRKASCHSLGGQHV
eukprot:1157626-Pelagomonas_calceolata.AAC.6